MIVSSGDGNDSYSGFQAAKNFCASQATEAGAITEPELCRRASVISAECCSIPKQAVDICAPVAPKSRLFTVQIFVIRFVGAQQPTPSRAQLPQQRTKKVAGR